MPDHRRATAAVAPRLAATTLVLRDSAGGLQVLMVRRSPHASFMPGAYVFPGGAVDEADASADARAALDEPAEALVERIGRVTRTGEQAVALAVAALRECLEECGLWLGAELAAPRIAALRARLHGGEPLGTLAAAEGLRLSTRALLPFARWVTPLGVPKRFDTLFFVVGAPAGQQPSVDQGETTTLVWVNPAAALADAARGDHPMEFATVSVMRTLLPFSAGPVRALLDRAAARADLAPVHPRLKLDAEGVIRGVLMPGDPGYDEAAGDGP